MVRRTTLTTRRERRPTARCRASYAKLRADLEEAVEVAITNNTNFTLKAESTTRGAMPRCRRAGSHQRRPPRRQRRIA